MPALLRTATLAVLALLTGCRPTDTHAQKDPYDSGGPLQPEQAAYDVTFYDLDLAVQPADSSLDGALTAVARVVHPLQRFVLDLAPELDVQAVYDADTDAALPYERRGGQVWVDLPRTRQPGETVAVRVRYGGQPRVAPRPPWQGGLTWARTADGQPWIATSCQGEGADLWWPVKDHVSDEPDSMALHVTVPEPLVVAANGRLRGVDEGDGERTYRWFVSTPINTYTVALNIAPYEVLTDTLQSVAGEVIPIEFYVLPEDVEKGIAFLPEIEDHLRWYERRIGPYPFRADKYGVAQTPHLGMEHQTIIAYGAGFDNGAMTGGRDWGFDALHHHELAHEWWGNLVTNADWSDMWLHEGFGSYMQALYVDDTQGRDAYHAYMNGAERGIRNQKPVAPHGSQSSQEIYFGSGGDIYSKGSWTLHTLRYLLGDDAFLEALRRMAYPTDEARQTTDGRQTRFAATDDFVSIAEAVSGRELDWFFDVYLRRADLPRLTTERDGDTLTLRWDAPGDGPFPMPVDVRIGDETRRVDMPNGTATLDVPAGAEVEIDPRNWVLKAD